MFPIMRNFRPVVVAYVQVCQKSRQIFETFGVFLSIAIGPWNLELFKAVIHNRPFCIHLEMSCSGMSLLSWNTLLFLTYIAATLHDRHPLGVNILRPAVYVHQSGISLAHYRLYLDFMFHGFGGSDFFAV